MRFGFGKSFSLSLDGGKQGTMLQSRECDIGIVGDVKMTQIEIKALCDQLWNRGQEELARVKKTPSYRGRLLGGQTIYWAYTHVAPKPMLLLSDKQKVQTEFWEAATNTKGEYRPMHEVVLLKDAVDQSLNAQAAEKNKRNN